MQGRRRRSIGDCLKWTAHQVIKKLELVLGALHCEHERARTHTHTQCCVKRRRCWPLKENRCCREPELRIKHTKSHFTAAAVAATAHTNIYCTYHNFNANVKYVVFVMHCLAFAHSLDFSSAARKSVSIGQWFDVRWLNGPMFNVRCVCLNIKLSAVHDI